MPESLDPLLEQTRANADFEAILLTDLNGVLIASSRGDETPPEMLEALLDLAARIAARPDDKVQLAAVRESEFFDWEGRRVICRWFTMGSPAQSRLLVVLAQNNSKPYKRAISGLVKQIRQGAASAS
ncbi:MAG: hypothetical protein IT324_11715 [Anaerolineae bacterium]|nr:hypothetical protein [Anaerolineae bacterium]